jgi:hypothetical protein
VPFADDDRQVVRLFLVVRELPHRAVDVPNDLSCGLPVALPEDFEQSSGAELFPERRFALEDTVCHQHRDVSFTENKRVFGALPLIAEESEGQTD